MLFGTLAVFFGVMSGACWAADLALGLVSASYYGDFRPLTKKGKWQRGDPLPICTVGVGKGAGAKGSCEVTA